MIVIVIVVVRRASRAVVAVARAAGDVGERLVAIVVGGLVGGAGDVDTIREDDWPLAERRRRFHSLLRLGAGGRAGSAKAR